jgi:hypothetical protein
VTNESIVCPKCNAAMEEGFILESEDIPNRVASRWVEGAPEFGFWSGIKNWHDRKKYQVATYRCAGCGYLESYALRAQE